jgi:phytoene dehydrogenase-like protein
MIRHLDIAVVGSGIGGSLISALNAEKNIILFEKDKNLGGCASTFKKYGNFFNAGATTFVGYENGHIIKNIFDTINIQPNITKSQIAIRNIQGKKVVDRIKDFDQFLEQIEQNYPHPNNQKFWSKIKEIDEKFWNLKKIYFGKFSIKRYYKTSKFIIELLKTYQFDIFKNASKYIEDVLYDISPEYKKFIDSQLLITVQAPSDNLSLLSLALGLSYPFHEVFYVNGGMGSLIEDIVKNIEVNNKSEITKIIRDNRSWIIETKDNQYRSKNVILNSSIYNCANLFEDKAIQKYYNSFEFSDQSAFVVYLTVDSQSDFIEHYQIILENSIPNCISSSFFISFSKKDDQKMSQNGYSVTISTHSKSIFWKNLSKPDYELEKLRTQEYIVSNFLEYFDMINKNEIIDKFSATSKTYNRYINRYNCGGKAISLENVSQLPSCTTPFNGLYNVGDTIFAGQGWPGVALGVDVLNKELNG